MWGDGGDGQATSGCSRWWWDSVRLGGAGVKTEIQTVEVALPNGATAFVRAVDLDDELGDGGATKTGRWEKFDLTQVAAVLEGFSTALKKPLAKAAPEKVTVEFSAELAFKSGMVTCLVVDGRAAGALKITLEWGHDRLASGEHGKGAGLGEAGEIQGTEAGSDDHECRA